MSRSGYIDDSCGEEWRHICWRGAVSSATKGKRGQKFFKELLTALDEMSVKRLIQDELEVKGEFCTLGVIGHARGVDMTDLDPEESKQISEVFDIANALACEIVWMNDEYTYGPETPEARWTRMRKWVEDQIVNN